MGLDNAVAGRKIVLRKKRHAAEGLVQDRAGLYRRGAQREASRHRGTLRDGLAQNIQVTRSLDGGLDQSAIAAVQQWRFKPGEKNGTPVRVAAKIEINFRLK